MGEKKPPPKPRPTKNLTGRRQKDRKKREIKICNNIVQIGPNVCVVTIKGPFSVVKHRGGQIS